MKALILITILILQSVILFAQQDELLKRLEEQAVQVSKLENKVKQLEDENKDLRKQLKQRQNNSARMEKSLRDSLSAPIFKLTLQLESVKAALNDKDREMNRMNEDFKDQLRTEKARIVKEQESKFLTQIANKYKKPFDTLVNSLTTFSLESDKKLFNDLNYSDSNTNKTINDLLTYKGATLLLEKKFDPIKISQEKEKINQIQNASKVVPQLIDLLDKYEIRKEGLVMTFQEIQKLNDLPANGNEIITAEKWKEIWNNLTQYLIAYGVNMEDYPNFRRCILNVVQLKQENIDSDISSVINLL